MNNLPLVFVDVVVGISFIIVVVLTIAIITIIRQIWKCTPKTQPKANRNFDQVELRHIFDNVGGCLTEERSKNDSAETNCQEKLLFL